MLKLNLANFLKDKDKANSVGSATNWLINYVRDWKIIVLIFAVGLISISIFSLKIYLSNQIGGGYISSEAETLTVSIEKIDQKSLQNSLNILNNRQINFEKTKTMQSRIVDPSI